MKKWTVDDSKELYNMVGWGTSYFGINDKGDVYVTPCKDNTQIDIRDVMDELALRDITPPVLLRFPDILDNRIEKTSSCFEKAAKACLRLYQCDESLHHHQKGRYPSGV